MFFAALLIVLSCNPLFAQVITADSIQQPLLLSNDTLYQTSQIILPPQAAKPKKISPLLKKASLVAVGAGLWYTTYSVADEPVQDFTQKNKSDATIRVARTMEPLGKQTTYLPFVGTALLGGIFLKKPKLQEAGMVTLGSLLVNAVLTENLKNAFQRHRPESSPEHNLFDGPSGNDNNTSLPSSHTSTAFAAATSIASVYKDSKFIPPLVYGMATMVGISRIHDNKHWASDVLAGAAVGYLTAKGVHLLYRLADSKLQARNKRLIITPQLSLKSASINTAIVF